MDVSVTYVGVASDFADSAASRTFVSQSLGTAAANRRTVIVASITAVGPLTPTLTVGGVAATLEASAQDGANWVGIFGLDTPSGSSADITISPGGVFTYDASVWVHAIYGASGAATAHNTSSGAGASLNLDVAVPDGGAVFAGLNIYDFSAVSWSGVTLSETHADTGYPNHLHSAAAAVVSTGASPRTVTATLTVVSAAAAAGVSVAYSPAAGGSTGSLSSTLAASTLSATGTVAVSGQLSEMLAAATLSATAVVAVIGQASATLVGATLSAAGTVSVAGTLSAALAGATLSGSAQIAVQGQLSQALTAATLAGTATVAASGNLSATLGAATLAGTSTVSVTAALSATLAGARLSGSAAIAITGSLNAMLKAATLAATGTTQELAREHQRYAIGVSVRQSAAIGVSVRQSAAIAARAA